MFPIGQVLMSVEQGVATGAVTIPQTPSEWLLTRYDRVLRRAFGPQGDGRRMRRDRGSNFDRNLFDVIDDHPGDECCLDDVFSTGSCIYWSGQASWPQPTLGEGLIVDVAFDEIA